VASSQIGKDHEVQLFSLSGQTASPTPTTLQKHSDIIYGLAFSPDGKLLASGSYDRLIRVWSTGGEAKEIHILKDHSDAVYGVAFSPDGALLASGGADRAVKVWDVPSGRRLFTLGESTDWVYAVAWSPLWQQGETPSYLLAAAGVDRSIRIWKVNREGGEIVHSVFAHEAAITHLAYSRDGRTLYSLAEDRRVKAWDTRKMIERGRHYPRQEESVLSFAVRPDGKQLALGRYDGTLVLLDAVTGKEQARPLSGKTNRQGKAAPTTPTYFTSHEAPPSAKPPAKREEIIREVEPNNSHSRGQPITLSATLAGNLERAGDVDFFRFKAQANQEVGVHLLPPAKGSRLEAILEIQGPDGQIVESGSGLLAYTCKQAGTYSLSVRDRQYRGGKGMDYRLKVGAVPVVTGVFPLGVQRGMMTPVSVQGVYLGERAVTMKVPADAPVGSRLPVSVQSPLGTPAGKAEVIVGEFTEAMNTKEGGLMTVPGTANGRLSEPESTQTWRFPARKDQRLLLEVNARRLGSPLDSVIEILDEKGQPVPRATLRCLARTFVVFRDHNSTSPGIRIETWSELAIDDYLLVGEELMRIQALPKNPDDDCRFYSLQGKRLAFLGTSPVFHPQGQPMYKVSIHPPGTTFPPNGLPVITVPYRNDDGGPRFGKDSRLVFDPPADGTYQVRIRDARGRGGLDFSYRLTVRPPRPDFTVRFNPTAPQVSQGAALPIKVEATRLDEFQGPIEVELHNLPPGFSAPATAILPGEHDTSLALFADPEATVPDKAPKLELVARAMIDGKEVVRRFTGGLPRVIPPGDIVTTTDRAEVSLRPGRKARLTVTVERRNGFKGRIPLDVRGLPHGVRVLNIGLNGILITPSETRRTIVLYAEPWVEAMEHPIVILARREGKNSEHAARSVQLKIVGQPRKNAP
jgi:hypothetical protein